jgi:hypothetical protein
MDTKYNNEKQPECSDFFDEEMLATDNLGDQFFIDEELTFFTIKTLNEEYLQSANQFSGFQESLDIDKANFALSKSKVSLPEHLKRYADIELKKQFKEKKSLLVEIFQSGVRLLNTVLPNEGMELAMQASPSLRSSATAEKSSVKIQETIDENTKVTYQIIKENTSEVFLYVKFNSQANQYDHVNLKNKERLIYSSTLNREGVITFSGLKPDAYTLEFIGQNTSKSVDLEVLSE